MSSKWSETVGDLEVFWSDDDDDDDWLCFALFCAAGVVWLLQSMMVLSC